jgi:hypothetical protein
MPVASCHGPARVYDARMTLILAAVVLIALMALLALRGPEGQRDAPDDEDAEQDVADPPHWWGAERGQRRAGDRKRPPGSF